MKRTKYNHTKQIAWISMIGISSYLIYSVVALSVSFLLSCTSIQSVKKVNEPQWYKDQRQADIKKATAFKVNSHQSNQR